VSRSKLIPAIDARDSKPFCGPEKPGGFGGQTAKEGGLAERPALQESSLKKIQDKDLKKSLLPEQVAYNGKTITAPVGWLPKPEPEDGQAVVLEANKVYFLGPVNT
jgi:hypothetical protein